MACCSRQCQAAQQDLPDSEINAFDMEDVDLSDNKLLQFCKGPELDTTDELDTLMAEMQTYLPAYIRIDTILSNLKYTEPFTSEMIECNSVIDYLYKN